MSAPTIRMPMPRAASTTALLHSCSRTSESLVALFAIAHLLFGRGFVVRVCLRKSRVALLLLCRIVRTSREKQTVPILPFSIITPALSVKYSALAARPVPAEGLEDEAL